MRANVEGIKAGDPDALAFVGYLPSMPPADKILGTRHTDFSNMHFYGSLRDFPLEFKLIDRRAYGKGLSLGEFGAQEAHDARVNGQTGQPVQASVTRFEQVVHYTVGLGGTFLCNWDWKDFDEMVFPWGLVHHSTPVPKPCLYTLAQSAELLKHVRPRYEPPQVYLLVPDSHRIGARFDAIHRALQNAVRLLLNQRVNFGVLNEEDLYEIPPSARAIFWVLPYCPSDTVFEKVLEWVRRGGVLYLSGNIGFDRTRLPSRAERFRLLGLPEQPVVSPFEVSEEVRQLSPLVRAVGQGRVVYVSYPLELRPQADHGPVYTEVLSLAQIKPLQVVVEGGEVHALSIPTREGGRLYTLIRTDEAGGKCMVRLPAHRVELHLLPKGSAFMLVDAQGEVLAAESEGELRYNDEVIASAEGHFGLVSLDGKGLHSSRQLLVLPHQQGRVSLFLLKHGRAAVAPLSTISSARLRKRESADVRFGIGEVGMVRE